MDERIIKAKNMVTEAENALRQVVLDVQNECRHDKVIEGPQDFGYKHRLCLDCGYEEVASYWPGYQHGCFPYYDSALVYNKKMVNTVLNTEFIKTVDDNEIWNNRI